MYALIFPEKQRTIDNRSQTCMKIFDRDCDCLTAHSAVKGKKMLASLASLQLFGPFISDLANGL